MQCDKKKLAEMLAIRDMIDELYSDKIMELAEPYKNT